MADSFEARLFLENIDETRPAARVDAAPFCIYSIRISCGLA
jgi:hypothetical protein